MDKISIEKEARRLQIEIWGRREQHFPLGVPDISTIFDPRNVADFCGLFYEERDRLEAAYPGGGPAAGIWNRDRRTVLISSQYSYEVQRYTGGHEIGHFILHPNVGERVMHRERALSGNGIVRSQQEQEADYFSSCLLMPRGAVEKEFTARFGGKQPLSLTEDVAFHLGADMRELFAQPRESLMFARAVASAQNFDRRRFKSLTQYFQVSPMAMAIRLDELELVTGYLHR
jgi:Zn-dependent peptidase ImmA (M78 family)